jgi:hypothetical protein
MKWGQLELSFTIGGTSSYARKADCLLYGRILQEIICFVFIMLNVHLLYDLGILSRKLLPKSSEN